MTRAPTPASASGDAKPYAGRQIALATMHRKERAIGPAIHRGLDARVVVPEGLDTDALGTFSGEVERRGTMGEVAVAKARLGMAATGLGIGLASEGTYGPHPSMPFVPAGIELLVLVDDERGFHVSESMIDTTPSFGHATVVPGETPLKLLDRIGFPEHAVIVSPNDSPSGRPVAKGIRSRAELQEAVAAAAGASGDGRARVESDMRAHMNPTRMAVLQRLAEKLVARLSCPCTGCGTPGFGAVDAVTGLPCEWCGGETLMVRHQVFGCVICDYRESRPRPDGLLQADPQYCPGCNP